MLLSAFIRVYLRFHYCSSWRSWRPWRFNLLFLFYGIDPLQSPASRDSGQSAKYRRTLQESSSIWTPRRVVYVRKRTEQSNARADNSSSSSRQQVLLPHNWRASASGYVHRRRPFYDWHPLETPLKRRVHNGRLCVSAFICGFNQFFLAFLAVQYFVFDLDSDSWRFLLTLSSASQIAFAPSTMRGVCRCMVSGST